MKPMQKWKTIESETVFLAAPYIRVVREKVAIRPNLTVDDFFQVLLRPFVTCVPFLKNGNVLMLRQYKHGPRRVTLTFPGGFVENSEPVEDACERELLEETGHCFQSLVSLGAFVDNGNQRGCEGAFFLARGCSFEQIPQPDDLEEMELLELAPKQIDQALTAGDICLTHHAFAWLLAKDWFQQERIVM